MQENMEPMVEIEKEITNISTSDFYSELAKKSVDTTQNCC